ALSPFATRCSCWNHSNRFSSESFRRLFVANRSSKQLEGSIMTKVKSFFTCVGLVFLAATASAGERQQIPMTADRWQTDTGVFEKIQGVDAIALRQGMASPKGVTLRNGTVEFDVQPFAMGTGL